MKKSDLYDRVTELNDGNEIPTTLFDFFLDTAQMYWENRRPWVVLRAEDTTQTLAAGSTFETPKDLPADFRKWYTRFPVVLTDASANPQQFLTEIPIHMKTAYKDNGSRFYCNYRTKKIYICGTPQSSYTMRQYYLRRATKISADDDNEWELDPNDEFSPILAFTIVVYHKLGVDYDIINNAQSEANAGFAKQIYTAMEEWDAELAEAALNGQTYGTGGGSGRYFGSDGLSGSLDLLG